MKSLCLIMLTVILLLSCSCVAHNGENEVTDYLVTSRIPESKPTSIAITPTPLPLPTEVEPKATATAFSAALSDEDIADAKRFVINYYNSLDGWTRFDINTVTILIASDNHSLYYSGSASYEPGLAILLYFWENPDDEYSPRWLMMLTRDSIDSEWRIVNQGY